MFAPESEEIGPAPLGMRVGMSVQLLSERYRDQFPAFSRIPVARFLFRTAQFSKVAVDIYKGLRLNGVCLFLQYEPNTMYCGKQCKAKTVGTPFPTETGSHVSCNAVRTLRGEIFSLGYTAPRLPTFLAHVCSSNSVAPQP